MKIAVFGNTYRKETLEQVKILFRVLKERNIFVAVEKSFYDFMTEELCFNPDVDEIIGESNVVFDLALSIGGDGTFLKTASFIGDKNIPILGINTGRLGFLADISGDEIEPTIDEILQSRYSIEKRSVLQLCIHQKESETYGYALNEIAVSKQDSSSMITIHTKIDDVFLNDYQSDGLIVSTPTGSTAYSMSVGGPLVLPQSKNLIISAVAPHSLNVRPLVLPDDVQIELSVESRSSCFLISLDGRSAVMDKHTKLFIKKAPFHICVLKREGHTFFNTLRTKLMWGADKRNSSV
ncbi:MAG: NAD kinase [Paludibacteraceae bacterium]|nr:NAD kinase [Paludibacteraceae bacterium]